MGKKSEKDREAVFLNSLVGKEVPILTLDHKWYRLLDEVGREDVLPLEEQLNTLLKKQGKLNSEMKEIKRVKKRLMDEIVSLADASDQGGSAKIDENKRLIEESNTLLEKKQEEMIGLPEEIFQVNRQLMLVTMSHCYDTMQENTDEIQELEEWVTQIRIQLKKNLIHKQEMEAKNHEIYSYMHDLFGADVVDLFDMRYNPQEKHPVVSKEEN